MLSVSTVKSAGGAAGYYTAEDNYYFLGEQSTEWYGTGAESLGLEGAVGKNAFTNVLEGLLPDGTDMRRMEGEVNKHRPGYDLTFSAPKSVSVLALVTGDKFLIEAHQRAVRRTLDEVEKIASTRTMTDGISEIEMTGNLLAAVFMHDTSRNLDPNLHSHAVVANTTLSQGGWKTLSTDIKGQNSFTDIVWNQQVSIGAIYRGFLRQDVEEHGYPTTDTGSRGEWDITGVPVKPFSSRREQILDAVGGEATAKQKSVAALDTRQAKQFTEMESVREHWKETLAETGFDADAFRAEVKSRGEQKADNQRDQPERSPSSPVQRDGGDLSKSPANTMLPDSDKVREKEATEQRDNAGETIKPRENEPADVVQERREHAPQKPAHAPEKAVPPHATDTGKSVTSSPESPALPGAEAKGQSPAVAEPVQSDPASTPPEAKQHKAPLQEGKPVTPEPESPAMPGTEAHGQSPAVAESVQPGPAITPPESKQHEASLQEGKPVTPEPENPALPGEENTSPHLEQAVPAAQEAGNHAPEKARTVVAPAIQSAVTQAIDRLSDKGVRFTWDDVMTSVINHSRVEPGIYSNIRAGIEQAVERGLLIAVDKNQTLFTSSAHIRDEARLSQVAESLAARPGGLSAPDTSTGALAQVALADTAISLVDLRGGTAFAAEFSRNVHALAEHNNRPLVVVAADTASLKRQSQVLGNPAGVQTSTPEGLREQGIPAGALVYISESERLNTTALHDVLKEASLQGATTIVTDTRARRATGFGAEVLRTAGVKDFTASPATENVRVTMVQKETVEDRLTVAARYYAQEKSHGNEVRLQAGNERTRDKLTSRTREALQEEGGLGQVLGEINVRLPVWLDASNRNDRSRYREGQILEHHPAQGKATTFSIAGINTRYNTLTLTDEKGQLTGMKISDIDSHWRLFREKKIEVREGEQLRMTADAGPAAKRGDTVTVTGVKEGSWLFKDRLVMKNSDGVAFKVDKNAPVYADYGYTESFGASRRGSGSVIAVLAGKEVDDTTLNLLRRSGGNVVAFTPLDEATINKRLEANRPSITVTQGVKSQAGKEDLAEALRELGTRKMNYPERVTRIAVEKATGTKVTFDRL
ncbi:MobF family relaxase [Candidatus Pantoea multigeneris]|uniref:Conjugative relaxase n=1 Tax=Candidatus Pantoea multigeneris TaxID=2608357 RepID=A0ABX0RJZ8_9GAMM|nr:MobF family relaxase [Pantoea multigeneris]NIF23934.1 conjugative relaxase [Pantoea multigeneris]